MKCIKQNKKNLMDSINTSKHNKIKFQMYFKSTESMITIDFTLEIDA